MPLVFGEVDATPKPDLSFPPARDQVMLHDHSGTGFPMWEPLINGGAPAGIVSFNGLGLEIVSPDVSTASPNGQMFGASALNRFTRPPQTKAYLIFDWKLRIFRSASSNYTYSKGVEFGLDTADWGTAGTGGSANGGLEPVAANRALCMARCNIYDEVGTYYGGKWQLTSGSAGNPGYTDLKDSSGNLISPTVAGYEALQVGMNYGKWLRQKTEMVITLAPTTISATSQALSVTSASTTATYSGAQPIIGAPVTGTSVAAGTFIAAASAGTATLSQAASATTSTLAGAAVGSAKVVARLEGLRHNGVGFGSLAVGGTGYSTDTTANPRANELLAQQATPNASGVSLPAICMDAGFQGGMNAYAQIDNRSNQPSKAKLLITRARLGVFA